MPRAETHNEDISLKEDTSEVESQDLVGTKDIIPRSPTSADFKMTATELISSILLRATERYEEDVHADATGLYIMLMVETSEEHPTSKYASDQSDAKEALACRFQFTGPQSPRSPQSPH